MKPPFLPLLFHPFLRSIPSSHLPRKLPAGISMVSLIVDLWQRRTDRDNSLPCRRNRIVGRVSRTKISLGGGVEIDRGEFVADRIVRFPRNNSDILSSSLSLSLSLSLSITRYIYITRSENFKKLQRKNKRKISIYTENSKFELRRGLKTAVRDPINEFVRVKKGRKARNENWRWNGGRRKMANRVQRRRIST